MASGKTTFAGHLTSLLGQENVNLLNTDPYNKLFMHPNHEKFDIVIRNQD
ncbi:hypothetical protein MKZ07_00105 [Paenibacillus sp. FSL P4-0338]|nr:hypothetical protein [Paenibacillus sp. FSL R7-269]